MTETQDLKPGGGSKVGKVTECGTAKHGKSQGNCLFKEKGEAVMSKGMQPF